ncbi:MAG TPA: sulfatase [Candidatus Parabacteroides intestinigallinarum]|uniref:Sulfatase n=1 Tax=Candidatus Parabacteroides intestinigallinarum TaxID=2838722 RepID=A0A9D1XP67_9BACT|nr:sulfatase [Candidatus Parabacteroides intestinigallinarum]
MRTLNFISLATMAVAASTQMDVYASAPERPNFVIILCDDMGYGDLSCYGNPTIQTPNIDRMADEGMKLTQFYVGAAISTPSRSALLTGRLPVRNGMYGDRKGVLFPDSKAGLGQDEITIAKVLRQNGYATGCVGKWHLGAFSPYLPTDHGFDYYFGIPYSNDMSPAQNKGSHARNYPPTPLILGDKKIEDEPDQGELTRRYTEKAVEFIHEHAKEPFFLYFAHTFPHIPLYTNARFEGTSKRGLYGDVVEEIDWSVGEVLKALREHGLDDNTFVIFTSDNGPWLTERENGGSAGPLKDGKGTWWEGGFRVPAICWMPGKIAPAINDEMMATMDLYPTFLAMAGIERPEGVVLDGVDQSGFLFEEKRSARDEVYYWWGSELMAVRKGEWKYYFKTIKDQYLRTCQIEIPAEPLLYNVEVDISEKFNQAKSHPEIVRALIELGENHKRDMKIKPSVCDM